MTYPRPLRFHDIRHTTASLLIMAGADLPTVQRIMRHSDPSITTEFYAHLSPGYLRNAIDRLAINPSGPEVGPVAATSGATDATNSPASHTTDPLPFAARLLQAFRDREIDARHESEKAPAFGNL